MSCIEGKGVWKTFTVLHKYRAICSSNIKSITPCRLDCIMYTLNISTIFRKAKSVLKKEPFKLNRQNWIIHQKDMNFCNDNNDRGSFVILSKIQLKWNMYKLASIKEGLYLVFQCLEKIFYFDKDYFRIIFCSDLMRNRDIKG